MRLSARPGSALPSRAVLFFAFGGLVLALAIAAAPETVQVCGPDYQTGQRKCGSYELVEGALWWVVDSINSNQGFFTVLLTGLLAYVTVLQHRTLSSQHSLERQQFFALHRARLKVRKVYLAKSHPASPPFRFEAELADVGYGGATVYESRLAVVPVMRASFGRSAHARVSELKAALDDAEPRGPKPVPKDGSLLIPYDVTDEEEAGEILKADAVYAVGYVVYGNENSPQKYRLGFLRVLKPVEDWTFRPADIPDFEYSD